MKNPVSWFEIAVNDMNRAKKFYESVFGNELIDLQMGSSQLAMFPSIEGSPNCSGALVKDNDNVPSTDGTRIYFSCNDVAVESELVAKNGGQIVVPKMSLGEFGFMAMFIDTEGNMVGLHSDN
jgi:uncharacterized protein